MITNDIIFRMEFQLKNIIVFISTKRINYGREMVRQRCDFFSICFTLFFSHFITWYAMLTAHIFSFNKTHFFSTFSECQLWLYLQNDGFTVP